MCLVLKKPCRKVIMMRCMCYNLKQCRSYYSALECHILFNRAYKVQTDDGKSFDVTSEMVEVKRYRKTVHG